MYSAIILGPNSQAQEAGSLLSVHGERKSKSDCKDRYWRCKRLYKAPVSTVFPAARFSKEKEQCQGFVPEATRALGISDEDEDEYISRTHLPMWMLKI